CGRAARSQGRSLRNDVLLPSPAMNAPTFHRVGLIAKHDDANAARTLAAVIAHLAPQRIALVAGATTAAQHPQLAAGDPAECDLVLVIGGDGTMLHAARLLAPRRVPLVGINAGRLGFLADIPAEDLKRSLDAVLAGDFVEEPRLLLRADVEG